MNNRVHELRLDRTQRSAAQSGKCHNRWHPAVPPALRVDSGDEVMVDTLDALDGQIKPTHTAVNAAEWDLNAAHPLTGPIWIHGAEPGDLLEVELLDITAGDTGWTAQLPGFGFLRDIFPEPHRVRWSLKET
jgi:formamidase